MLPKSIQNLINQFAKLPLVGPRQAARFVFYLIKQTQQDTEEFAKALFSIKKLKKCSLCFRIIEESNMCSICENSKRDKFTICVVEKDTDIEAIEKTGRYNGLYYVLKGSEAKDLKELLNRIRKDKNIKEAIIATSATTDGDTLALYIARLLKPLSIKITRLGRGLSTGSELEYMDEETLSQALLGRK